jgi:hypothetical protein
MKTFLKIAAISIASIFSLILAMKCFFYFSYDKGNIFKDQTIFTNKSNRLAMKFIKDYNSGNIDSIIYKINGYSFSVGHGKWMYWHSLSDSDHFHSYLDKSQNVFVNQNYYSLNNDTQKNKVNCTEIDKDIFNKISSIRNKYGLNSYGRRVYCFNNGVTYFRGKEVDMYGYGLPINIRKNAKLIINNWYKIPRPN